MDERYCSGISELDTQHEQIEEAVASLLDEMESKASADLLQSALVRLDELLRFHFAVEDSVMEILSYPFVLEHRFAHREILQHIGDLKDVLRQRGAIDDSSGSVHKLAFDIARHDRVFAGFVKTHGESLRH